MAARRESLTLSIDLAGGATVALLLAAGIWFGLIRPSPAKAELGRLRAELELKRRDLAGLERESARFESERAKRSEELAGAGTPPAQSPIEEDLRTLTELMRRHGLHVAEVSPLGSTSYPGVLESKYRLRATGRCGDLARALRGFEHCRFWGDITHLTIAAPGGASSAAGETREADLTLSFYSAQSPAGSSQAGSKP